VSINDNVSSGLPVLQVTLSLLQGPRREGDQSGAGMSSHTGGAE